LPSLLSIIKTWKVGNSRGGKEKQFNNKSREGREKQERQVNAGKAAKAGRQ